MEREEIIKILKEKKVKITNNRIAVLNCLADETHFHTVSQIVEHLRDINIKSVYNAVKKLTSEGIVDTYSFEGVSKYAINDNYKNEHNVIHVVNEKLDVTHIDVAPRIFKAIEREIKKNGYQTKNINIFVNIKKTTK
ncbi:MAG: transcriptional repressor [Mycoplasmatales bacterium]|nr:transcriptional repressor [Mycoplasmatales bacterium]